MKHLSILFFFICSLVLGLIACGPSAEDSSVREAARNSLSVPETVAPPASTTPGAPPAVNTSGVQHYICPNNCAGSGGPSAGTCPVCGSAYEHNQAYHNTPASTQPVTTINPDGTPAESPGAITPPASTSPAQNAAGVYHYTCAKGCEGGAGSAVACATCGETLVHNQAYHN